MTTKEAATELGVSVRTVQWLITSGQLPAGWHGRDRSIEPADLEKVRKRPRPGWPKGRPRGRKKSEKS